MQPNILIVAHAQSGGTLTYIKSLQQLKNFNTTTHFLNPQINFTNINHQLSLYRLLYRQRKNLLNTIKNNQPSLVISVGTLANLQTTYLNKPHLFTHLATHHTPPLLTLKTYFQSITPLLKLLLPRIYAPTTHHLSISKELATHIAHDLKLPLTSIHIIQNGVPLTTPPPSPKKLTSPLKLLYIARFTPQKDPYTLIRSLPYLPPNLKYHLTIVGQGPTLNQTKQLTNQLNLHHSITFINHTKNINLLYQQHHLFILTSHYEGLPYTILEALSHALPVIATNIPTGPKEIIGHHSCGILVPPQQPYSLAKAIIALTNPQTYHLYSQQAIKRSHQFSQTRMLKQYTQLINKLLTL